MKFFFRLLVFLLILIPLVSANVQYVSLPYKNTLSPSQAFSTVNVNFNVKDSSGNSIDNALIIIQGISDQSFNQNIFTNSNGEASISLNTNEIFVYTVYKFTIFLQTQTKIFKLGLIKFQMTSGIFIIKIMGKLKFS